MRIMSTIGFVFFFTVFTAMEKTVWQDFDKANFYKTMASDSVKDIDNEIKIVSTASFPEREAYEGALLMKKAGLVKKASEKLKLFKSGCIKLETALIKDSTNIEYHFLRLSIQEHAPHTVKYYKDLEKDKAIIQRSFKHLEPVIQKAITDYSKNSKILRPEDLTFKN